MPTIPWDTIVQFGRELLESKGIDADEALYMADVAAVSEAFGAPTHGLAVLGYYHRVLGESIDPAARPVVVRDKGAAVLIDGQDGLAQPAIRLGKTHAASKARELGLCMVAIRNVGWCAALGAYLIDLAEAGFCAQAWAQHSSCKDCPPYGGLDGKFSTDPVAFGYPIPGGVSVADFSTATYSMGQIRMMKQAGLKAPEKVFIEQGGELSDDPFTMERGGTMFQTGGLHFGYKGYAMGLWCETMAILAGGWANNPDKPGKQAVNLLVIDPEAFGGRDHFRSEMERFVAHVKDTRLMDGFDGVRLPGENSYHRVQQARKDGLNVPDKTLEDLRDIGRKEGLATKL